MFIYVQKWCWTCFINWKGYIFLLISKSKLEPLWSYKVAPCWESGCNMYNNQRSTHTKLNVIERHLEVDIRGGFRGGGLLFEKKFGCLYRESLNHDLSEPPLRSVSGPPLKKISGSATGYTVSNRRWNREQYGEF